jgi:hypothetical protein
MRIVFGNGMSELCGTCTEDRYEKCVQGFGFENLGGEETAWNPRVGGRVIDY